MTMGSLVLAVLALLSMPQAPKRSAQSPPQQSPAATTPSQIVSVPGSVRVGADIPVLIKLAPSPAGQRKYLFVNFYRTDAARSLQHKSLAIEDNVSNDADAKAGLVSYVVGTNLTWLSGSISDVD